MPYTVADRVEVSVVINGQDYPMGVGENVLGYLHIGVSSKFKLPTIALQLIDSLHHLDKVNLQDGLILGITIKAKSGKTRSMVFRKFNHTRNYNGDSYIYTFDGYLDYPKFWLGTGPNGIKGSSAEALAQIAERCGLVYDGNVTTNDRQQWMQANATYSDWAREIEANGYVNDQSYMKWAVQLDGRLSYRNLSVVPQPTIKVVAYQDQAGTLKALDYAASASSGLTNAVNGYANTKIQPSAVADDSHHDTVSVPSNAKSPMINTAVRDIQGRGTYTYSPIDFGNVHQNYERAAYQNQRFASLMSVAVDFLFDDYTGVNIFDSFTFSADTDASKQDVPNTGTYAIGSHAIYITGANYWEKIMGVRNGVNLNYVAK